MNPKKFLIGANCTGKLPLYPLLPETETKCYDDFKPIKKVYVASPYSHVNFEVMDEREDLITFIAAKLQEKYKHAFFLPITQSAPLVRWNPRLSGDFDAWEAVDLTWVSVCDELWVVTMDGWKTSKGVQAEIQFATEKQIPVKYINPVTLEIVIA